MPFWEKPRRTYRSGGIYIIRGHWCYRYLRSRGWGEREPQALNFVHVDGGSFSPAVLSHAAFSCRSLPIPDAPTPRRPVHGQTRDLMMETLSELGIASHGSGTMVSIEGMATLTLSWVHLARVTQPSASCDGLWSATASNTCGCIAMNSWSPLGSDLTSGLSIVIHDTPGASALPRRARGQVSVRPPLKS